MEPLTYPVGLWAFSFGFGVIDILYGQVELIFVVLSGSTIFSTSIGQDTHQRNIVLLIKRQHLVVERISCHQSIFPIIKFGESHSAVGIYEGLLINLADPFNITHIVSILCS